MDSSKLFEKIILNNNIEISNRLAIAPMGLFASTPDGSMTDEEREYLKVRGTDIGLYILGASIISKEGIYTPNLSQAMSEKDVPALKERADIIKSQGAKAINQIHHGGLYANKELSGVSPVGPSIGIPNEEFEKRKIDSSLIKELTDEEIKKIIQNFAYAAELSLKAGYDGVEIMEQIIFFFNNFILHILIIVLMTGEAQMKNV